MPLDMTELAQHSQNFAGPKFSDTIEVPVQLAGSSLFFYRNSAGDDVTVPGFFDRAIPTLVSADALWVVEGGAVATGATLYSTLVVGNPPTVTLTEVGAGEGVVQSVSAGDNVTLTGTATNPIVNVGPDIDVPGSGTFGGVVSNTVLTNIPAHFKNTGNGFTKIAVTNSEGGAALQTDGDVAEIWNTDTNGVATTRALAAIDGAGTQIYFNGALRFQTTANGVDVNGVPYAWPTANAAGVFTNDGSGALSFTPLPVAAFVDVGAGGTLEEVVNSLVAAGIMAGS